MSAITQLTKEEYAAIIGVLEYLNSRAPDVSIVDGKIFQFNQNRDIFYDID
jgi:hypothetical protein